MRPRTSLAPKKSTSQNQVQKFPISFSVLKLVTQISILSRLCTMNFRVAILLQQLPPSEVCCPQFPFSSAVCCCYTVPEAGAQGDMSPSMGPASRNGLPSSVGSKPLVGPTSSPTSALIHVGSRARCPECPNAKNPEIESLHQDPKSHTKSPHTKRVKSFRNSEVCSSGFPATVELQAPLMSLGSMT